MNSVVLMNHCEPLSLPIMVWRLREDAPAATWPKPVELKRQDTAIEQRVRSAEEQRHANQDWPVWGGQRENMHYSKLAQINRKNVKKLAVAWTFDTGEPGGLQTSPIIVGDVLYGITPTQKIFALNASTGKLLWKFDSGIKGTQPDRGLAYWSNGSEQRILVGVMNFLYALDAQTGKPNPTFGQAGRIDLFRIVTFKKDDFSSLPFQHRCQLQDGGIQRCELTLGTGRLLL